jgi:hypothetical protein
MFSPSYCRFSALLRPRLTSEHPSQHLTMLVALWQTFRPPRVIRATFLLMPVNFTLYHSVQVLGFSDMGHLTLLQRLSRFICRKLLTLTGQHAAVQRCAFVCSSGQHFAFGFLQISPLDEHPCRSANTSPCRVCRGLTPPSHQFDYHSQSGCAYAQRAMPGAPKKNRR